jgi:hypothetical protein
MEDIMEALAEPYERALLTIRGYAAELLDTGYPRDVFYEDLTRARDVLEKRGVPEEAKDAVVDVMDFLVGFCSNHMKLYDAFSLNVLSGLR